MSLKGALTELPLSDLVEMTSLGGKTGRLLVSAADGTVAGRLDFREGRLVDARASCAYVLALPTSCLRCREAVNWREFR